MHKINVRYGANHTRVLLAALIISTIIFVLTSATWGFLSISVLICAYLLDPTGRILKSSVSRIFIASIIILTVYQVESIIFWLLRLTVSPSIYVITTTFVTILLYLWLGYKKNVHGTILRFSRIDVLLLIPALLISGAYIARVILPSEPNNASIVRSITLANDDVSHFAMVDALVRNSSNLLIDSPTKMALPSHATYPMGWHVSTTVAAASFFPGIKDLTVSQMTIVYFSLKVATFAGVIFSITLFMYQIAFTLRFKLRSIWTALSIYFGIALSVFLIVMPQIFEGFFSFLPVLLYLALFVTFAISLQTSTVGRRYTQPLDIALICFVIGSSLCWILTGPVLAAGYLLLKLQSAGSIKRLTASTYVGITLFVCTFVFQLWLITHNDQSAVSTLASQGGITTPDFTLMTLLTGLLFFLCTKKRYSAITRGVCYSILPLYAILAAVICYISFSSPQLSYYYYKLEITILFLLLPLGFVAFIDFINNMSFFEKTSQTINHLIRLSIAIFIPIALIPSVIGYSYFENNVMRSVHYNLTREDAKEIVSVLDHTFGNTDSIPYFFIQGSPGRSIVASNISRTGTHNTSCISQIYSAIYSSDTKRIASSVTQCAPLLPKIIIYTDQATGHELHNIIPRDLFDENKVVLKNLA